MSKKLINNPSDVVDEALAGLAAACSELRLLQGHRVAVRADVDVVVNQGKVTLLSGGGSGHEPAHAGYVGKGMLTAAVAGAVFASPPPASILAALKTIRSPAGTLVIIKNYTGDRLNFGIAVERARSEGVRVEMVVVGEDCALPDTGKAAGRRGLCGTILVHKIAGAMADKGFSLDMIVGVAKKVASGMGTMSVSLSSCSVPGHQPSFTLSQEDMELGLGIHGEAGAHRTKLQPAKEVVRTMVDQILSKEEGFGYFNVEPGGSVALVVNNLGGTSNLELLVVMQEAISYLDEVGVAVDRVVFGSLMTSLEMPGVSLTLLTLEPGWEQYLDYETTAPGWPRSSGGCGHNYSRLNSDLMPCVEPKPQDPVGGAPATPLGEMLKSCVCAVCEVWIKEEEKLNSLDRGSGDGDCGSTLKAGAIGIQKTMSAIDWDNPKHVLLSLAAAVETHMGGTSGAIYNLFLSAAAGGLDSPSDPVSWATAMKQGMDAIMNYGGAKVGDRTMLDALAPALQVLLSQLTHPNSHPLHVLQQAVKACEEGVVYTGHMTVAGAGRSSYVHSSQLTQPDPGAHAVAVAMAAIHKQLSS